jgi:hypothetical protein
LYNVFSFLNHLQAVNKTLTQSLEEHVPGETPIRRASQKTDTLDKSAIQEFVADKLVTQLYSIVQRVHGSMPSNMLGDRDVFPKLPGTFQTFWCGFNTNIFNVLVPTHLFSSLPPA